MKMIAFPLAPSLPLAAALACAGVLLSGCLVPEKFTAKVEVQPDASYSFRYAGTVVNALALAQVKKAGTLTEKEQASLKDDADKIPAKDPDVRKMSYQGDGRYLMEIESKRARGQPLRSFSVFSVETEGDGVMVISAKQPSERDQRQLMQLGIQVDGTLEVALPKNAEVLSHNATSTPSFFGLFGAYSWKIGQLDQRPTMKVKFKP